MQHSCEGIFTMAKVICAYSGITFDVQYFPVKLQNREACHPLFLLSPAKLHGYYQLWLEQKLDSTESYLLFLATLRNTNLIDWRVPVCRTEHTASIVATYMPALFRISSKLQNIKHPSFSVPNIAITPDTATLDNVKYWLATWEAAYEDFLAGLRNDELRSKIARREAALEKLIKSPQIAPHKYANLLASWAADAGEFPQSIITNPQGQQVTISEYWQDIIKRCYRTESMLSIPEDDVNELIEHCEEYIDIGTIFSHHLFATLEEGVSRIRSLFGESFSSFSAENPGFRILNTEPSASGKTNIEAINLAILVDSAPKKEPIPSEYPSMFKFLQAKSKWDLAQKYKTVNSSNTESTESTNNQQGEIL